MNKFYSHLIVLAVGAVGGVAISIYVGKQVGVAKLIAKGVLR